jgi:hypothetical protein
VDDTVHEEDFQDVHDEYNHVPRYPSFHGNVYNRTERYPMSPPFRTSEWDDDNEDIQGSHSWQGSTSSESTSCAWNPWPFYDNL